MILLGLRVANHRCIPYQSQGGKGDLRSKMLNESLKKVKTRYAAFLDFDDLLNAALL